VVCSVDDTCNGSISLHRFLARKEVIFLEFSCLDFVVEVIAAAVAAAAAAAAAVAVAANDFSVKASFLESVAAAAVAYEGAVVVARG
jgi:hypothetical protein